MRIGDIDYLDKSGNPNEKESRPADMPALTATQMRRKKWKNWWYYNKWYVVCGGILLGIVLNVTGSYLGWWSNAPDFQIAYIGKSELPPDTAAALEEAFASLASDYNGDGKIIIQINQYIDGLENADGDPDTAYYEYASEVSLIGDISSCDSYFFLMDDPDQFQRDFQLLACPDGSCPDDTDYTVEDKVIPWSACRPLSEMDLGTYSFAVLGGEVTGSNQGLLSGLFIGRRCFFTDKTAAHADRCGELWDLLYRESRQ